MGMSGSFFIVIGFDGGQQGLDRDPPAGHELAAGLADRAAERLKMLGAPGGGRNSSIGGKAVAGSFASYVVSTGGVMLGMGRTSRCTWVSRTWVPPGTVSGSSGAARCTASPSEDEPERQISDSSRCRGRQ
jgi:hypothetical protein